MITTESFVKVYFTFLPFKKNNSIFDKTFSHGCKPTLKDCFFCIANLPKEIKIKGLLQKN